MEALIVSNALLWIGVLALCGVVLALTRQIGLLHERLGPAGALLTGSGPAVGEPAPELALSDLSGRALRIGGESAPRTLLFFLSPACPVCEELLPSVLRVVAEESPPLRLVLASDGEPESHRAFIRSKGLEAVPYVLSTELGLRFGVDRLPSAVLIDGRGVVRARGLVNSREHLESLFDAEALGVASIQEHLAREHGRLRAGGMS